MIATMTPDLTDDDKAILAELLRETIERDRFPCRRVCTRPNPRQSPVASANIRTDWLP
jgi:hypothetical protein